MMKLVRLQFVVCAMLMAIASPGAAVAERLDIDHRLYAPLHAAMERPHEGTVFYQTGPGGRVLDRILVSGTSAESDWTEALELIVAPRKGAVKSPAEWFSHFRPTSESACPAEVNVLGQDEASLTFSLEARPCATGAPLTGLYRVIYGRKTIYVVAAKRKGAITADQRAQWAALLASARLAG